MSGRKTNNHLSFFVFLRFVWKNKRFDTVFLSVIIKNIKKCYFYRCLKFYVILLRFFQIYFIAFQWLKLKYFSFYRSFLLYHIMHNMLLLSVFILFILFILYFFLLYSFFNDKKNKSVWCEIERGKICFFVKTSSSTEEEQACAWIEKHGCHWPIFVSGKK